MNNNNKIIEEIYTENFVWLIYLFIIGISFLANYFEVDYYKNRNHNSKEKYRTLNIFVFSVALIIYLYFLKGNYSNVKKINKCTDTKSKVLFNELNYLSSILISIAGIILLYIAIFDKDLETEIAFS